MQVAPIVGVKPLSPELLCLKPNPLPVESGKAAKIPLEKTPHGAKRFEEQGSSEF